MAIKTDLCQTWSETQKTGFLMKRLTWQIFLQTVDQEGGDEQGQGQGHLETETKAVNEVAPVPVDRYAVLTCLAMILWLLIITYMHGSRGADPLEVPVYGF